MLELTVVMAITGILTFFLINNFPASKIGLTDSANVLVADVRFAQSKALSGATFKGNSICGYGLHPDGNDPAKYILFAGPARTAMGGDCSAYSKVYDDNSEVWAIKTIVAKGVTFQKPFPDIFFEPPEPKVYIDGQPDIAQVAEIIIQSEDAVSCPPSSDKCRVICVYGSGRIEIAPNNSCQ